MAVTQYSRFTPLTAFKRLSFTLTLIFLSYFGLSLISIGEILRYIQQSIGCILVVQQSLKQVLLACVGKQDRYW